jgi:plasmid stabilization system protein ParE
MASEVRFHEEASAEYEAAFEWYFLRSEFAASRFVEEVNRAIRQVSEAPKRWPTGIHSARRILLQHFPFAIFYREVPSGIQILAVAHGRRRPGYGRAVSSNLLHFAELGSCFWISRPAHTIGVLL